MASLLAPSTSVKNSLNWQDFGKSLLIAAFSAPILVALTSFQSGQFNINWTAEWQLAVSSAAGYLIKNFFSTPSTTPPVTNSPMTK